MPLTTDTIIGPAHWSSYLVYGDDSGMEPDELKAANDWLETLGFPSIVDAGRDADGEDEEPWFTWAFDVYGGKTAGGTVCSYTAHWAT